MSSTQQLANELKDIRNDLKEIQSILKIQSKKISTLEKLSHKQPDMKEMLKHAMNLMEEVKERESKPIKPLRITTTSVRPSSKPSTLKPSSVLRC